MTSSDNIYYTFICYPDRVENKPNLEVKNREFNTGMIRPHHYTLIDVLNYILSMYKIFGYKYFYLIKYQFYNEKYTVLSIDEITPPQIEKYLLLL